MKKYIIVDIDGTVAKMGDRIKYITEQNPKDWDSFFEACDQDGPIIELVELVLKYYLTHEIIFCTGRKEGVRGKTEKWIDKYFRYINVRGISLPIKYTLVMRKANDFRADALVKPELIKEANIDLKDVSIALEDRDSMVKKWRELGVRCLQVAYGNF